MISVHIPIDRNVTWVKYSYERFLWSILLVFIVTFVLRHSLDCNLAWEKNPVRSIFFIKYHFQPFTFCREGVVARMILQVWQSISKLEKWLRQRPRVRRTPGPCQPHPRTLFRSAFVKRFWMTFQNSTPSSPIYRFNRSHKDCICLATSVSIWNNLSSLFLGLKPENMDPCICLFFSTKIRLDSHFSFVRSAFHFRTDFYDHHGCC